MIILEHPRKSSANVQKAIMLPPRGESGSGRAGTDPAVDSAPETESNALAGLQALAESNDITIANITGERPLILMIDDEPHVCVLTKLMLCEDGYKVATALDGDEAIAIFGKLRTHISLVILDLIMPSMDGEDVFNRLREIDPNIAVVLSSGFADEAKLDRMVANGLCGFIAKPYSQQRLLDQVREIVGAAPQSGA